LYIRLSVIYMNTLLKVALIVFAWLSFSRSFAGQIKHQDTIQHINPPYQQFYSKYINGNGIAIRSAAIVSDSALIIASQKLDLLLENLPVARKNLITNGAELHIIGRNQQTSDLPEFRDRKGVQYEDNGVMTDIDKRTRGMGGLYASCGEENLLNLPDDRYSGGYDICIHEFAHTLMGYGFDSVLRSKITAQYKETVAKGLWHGAYAASNEQEYWAELTMWYFGAHGDMLPGKKPAPGPKSLQAYDAGGYALLDSIYSGKLQPAVITKKSIAVAKGVVSGNSTQKAKLVIINNSTKKLSISWIDQAGNSKLFATVAPSTSYEHDTFYTHVWLIDDGQSPIYIQVFDPRCEIKLSKDY
jgi:hypothetical protein